jgi:hypothetical protein
MSTKKPYSRPHLVKSAVTLQAIAAAPVSSTPD